MFDRTTPMQDHGSDHSPRVSVVIPAFNAEAYIEAAVRSAQGQTFSDIEIIVIDDASTDRTPEILRVAAAEDPRIRCARMAVNSGPGASRNWGMAMARGTWVALLDADDRFHPERLSTLVRLAERVTADVVADNALLCFGDQERGRIIPQDRLSEPRSLGFQEFVDGCVHDPSAPRRVNYVFMHPMFRRKFLNEYGITYNDLNRNGEDFLFYVECFLSGAKWFLTPEPMYLYSVRDGSLTEIRSHDDLRRMVHRMRSLLRDKRVRQDRELTGSIRRHWIQIAGSYHYWSLKDAFFAGDPKGVARAVFRDRDSAGFIARELLTRAPTICRRLLRRYI